MLFDHVDLRVSDLERARRLYDALLPAMGYPTVAADPDNACYYAADDSKAQPFFGIVLDRTHKPNGSRIALRAPSQAEVDRLAAVARDAGAHAFEPAHLCEEYTPTYYATFFEDADGNKLEICCRS